MTRVFILRALGTLPDMPDDLTGVVDLAGVIWFRLPPGSDMPGCWINDDRIGAERLPEVVSWWQLITHRGPVAEYRLMPDLWSAA